MRYAGAHFTLAFLIATAAFVAGCAPAPVQKTDGFYVPTTLVVQSPEPSEIAYTPLAFGVLPGSDLQNFFVGRGEKFVYGSLPAAEVTSYSIWVYDNQPISLPGGSGNRYTWAVKEGVLFP